MRAFIFVLAAGFSIVGCSEGTDSRASEGRPKACSSISGGGTTAEVNQSECPGCFVTSPELAIDGDPNTAASFVAPSVALGFAGVRVTAQPGVVFSGGSTARATIALTGGGRVEVDATSVLRTYLAGELQEEASFDSNLIGVTTLSSDSKRQYAMKTSMPYDAVAFGFAGTAENISIEYYEYCSN